jgi:hypothetical protein
MRVIRTTALRTSGRGSIVKSAAPAAVLASPRCRQNGEKTRRLLNLLPLHWIDFPPSVTMFRAPVRLNMIAISAHCRFLVIRRG